MLGKIFQGIGIAVVASGVLRAIEKSSLDRRKRVAEQDWPADKERFLHDLAYYQDLSKKGYVIAGRFAEELEGIAGTDYTVTIDPEGRVARDGVLTERVVKLAPEDSHWICGVHCLKVPAAALLYL